MFRIGEFSKIAQVSGHLLRYYDEIGLLKPAKIDNWTGYRYYSAAQLPRLNRILALKDLGLTLEQIQQLLTDSVSANEIRGMLTLKKAQIEQTIQAEVARLCHIEARLDQIEREGELQDVDILIKAVPAQLSLSMRYTLSSLAERRLLLTEMMRLIPSHIDDGNIRHFAVIFHSDMFSTENVDVEPGFLLDKPVDTPVLLSNAYSLTLRTLPAVETMATVVRSGLPQVGHRSYANLRRWVEANRYRFAGPGREVFLVPPLPGQENETLTEIQFPVEKMGD